MVFRIILKTTSSHNYSQNKDSKSDSQKSKYQETINDILKDENRFENFRRNKRYREILEHVSYALGKKYLNQINNRSHQIRVDVDWDTIKLNDSVGKPVLFRYPEIGRISPTTLRYTSVALEILELFGSEIKTVAEIGAGYGGQARILDEFLDLEDYDCFDLPEVQNLIDRYIKVVQPKMRVGFPTLGNSDSKSWDLVISNYAFSELPYLVQEHYLKNVILKSKNGFMIMNSGRTNITGRSTGKHSVSDLLRIIPNSRICEEAPLTGPDNFILIWENAS